MIGDPFSFLWTEHPAFLFDPRDDPLDRRGEVIHRHLVGATSRRKDRRLIDEIGNVGAGEARGYAGDLFGIDARIGLDLLEMDPGDGGPAVAAGPNGDD